MIRGLVKFLGLFLVFAGLFSACTFPPSDKDEYFQQYDAFIAKLKEEQKTLSDEDWKDYEEHFKAFSVDYFQKFKGDMSSGEIIKAKKLATEYQFIKGKYKVREMFGGNEQEE